MNPLSFPGCRTLSERGNRCPQSRCRHRHHRRGGGCVGIRKDRAKRSRERDRAATHHRTNVQVVQDLDRINPCRSRPLELARNLNRHRCRGRSKRSPRDSIQRRRTDRGHTVIEGKFRDGLCRRIGSCRVRDKSELQLTAPQHRLEIDRRLREVRHLFGDGIRQCGKQCLGGL